MLNLFLSMPSDLQLAVGAMLVAVFYILYIWVKGFFNRPIRNEHKGQTYRKNHNTGNVDGVKWTADEAHKHWSNY